MNVRIHTWIAREIPMKNNRHFLAIIRIYITQKSLMQITLIQKTMYPLKKKGKTFSLQCWICVPYFKWEYVSMIFFHYIIKILCFILIRNEMQNTMEFSTRSMKASCHRYPYWDIFSGTFGRNRERKLDCFVVRLIMFWLVVDVIVYTRGPILIHFFFWKTSVVY